ncbi:hypothetical protein HDV63DRAFT_362542 [Trichoderma sp. SZMC 28014]
MQLLSHLWVFQLATGTVLCLWLCIFLLMLLSAAISEMFFELIIYCLRGENSLNMLMLSAFSSSIYDHHHHYY